MLERLGQRGLFLLGELGWLSAVSVVGGLWLGPGGPLLALPFLAGLLVAGAVLGRAAPGRLGPTGLALAGLGLVLLAGGLGWGATPALWPITARSLGALLLGLIAWGRGLRAGRVGLTVDRVWAEFRQGAVILVGLWLLGRPVVPDASVLNDRMLWSALSVLAAGLLGLPLARLGEMGPIPSGRRWTVRGWPPALGGGLLGLALLLAGLGTEHAALLRPLIDVVATALWVLLVILALPVGLLVSGLLVLLAPLLRSAGARPLPASAPPEWLDRLRDQVGAPSAPPVWLSGLAKGLVLVGAVGVVLWLTVHALRGRRAGEPAATGEEVRESIWRWADLWRALRSRRRGRRTVGSVSPPLPGLRALYRDLLRLGASHGHPRRPEETPWEYARRLGAQLTPAGRTALAALTDLYVAVRYGQRPVTAGALNRARTCLAIVRTALGAPDGAPATRGGR